QVSAGDSLGKRVPYLQVKRPIRQNHQDLTHTLIALAPFCAGLTLRNSRGPIIAAGRCRSDDACRQVQVPIICLYVSAGLSRTVPIGINGTVVEEKETAFRQSGSPSSFCCEPQAWTSR